MSIGRLRWIACDVIGEIPHPLHAPNSCIHTSPVSGSMSRMAAFPLYITICRKFFRRKVTTSSTRDSSSGLTSSRVSSVSEHIGIKTPWGGGGWGFGRTYSVSHSATRPSGRWFRYQVKRGPLSLRGNRTAPLVPSFVAERLQSNRGTRR